MGRENAKNIQKTNKICYCFGGGGKFSPLKALKKTLSVATIISSLNTDIKPDSISDCFLLGRFDPKHRQPRPLLVSLIHSSDVQTILAKCSKLSKPIVIKPHMSPEERINESLLLKVRWKLIQQGMKR